MHESSPEACPGWQGPLRLRDMGSFHVGGAPWQQQGKPKTRHLLAAGGQPVELDPNGTYLVGQMYAQYFLPEQPAQATPLLLWHGGGLTGACWETTPDGRAGWLQYFVRRGWDTYLCDAAERGRAGHAPQVWGEPLSQTAESVFERFRIGPGLGGDLSAAQTRAFTDGQFPVEVFEAFARQLVPRWAHTDQVALDAYAALLAHLPPSVVICHSQGGMFGLTSALRHPDRVRAVVALEPASVPAAVDDAGYDVPTLIMLGDRIDGDTRWPAMRARILAFAQRHACVEVISLPDRGLHGNSHMMMMDRNNLHIADIVHAWLATVLAQG